MTRRAIDVGELLRALGIFAKRQGPLWRARCPNPEHDDKDPSWRIVDRGKLDRRTGSHKCFSCGFGGGPWELVAAVRGLTLEEAGEWIRRELSGDRDAEIADVPRVRIVDPRGPRRAPPEFSLPYGVQIPSLDGSEWFPPAWEYLTRPVGSGGRGIPPWQVERWHVGFAIKGRCRHRVVVPIHTGGRLLSYVARAWVSDIPRYDAAERGVAGARPDAALWGEPGFDPDVSIATVTEGVFKGMAMERAGAPNPCAVLGASNLGPEKIDLLSRFELLLIATDPDAAGDASYEVLRDSLCRYSEIRRVPLRVAPDDASEEENAAAIARARRRRMIAP